MDAYAHSHRYPFHPSASHSYGPHAAHLAASSSASSEHPDADTPSHSHSALADLSRSATNVYLKGLPPHFAESTLLDLAQALLPGAPPPASVKIIKDHATGTGAGIGFVKFAQPSLAAAFIERVHLHARMSLADYGGFGDAAPGRRSGSGAGGGGEGVNPLAGVEACFAKETYLGKMQRASDQTSANLYLSHIPLHYTEHDILSLFPYPRYVIRSLRLLHQGDQPGQRAADPHAPFKGAAFARFASRAMALDAVREYNGKFLPGHSVTSGAGGQQGRGGREKRETLQVRFADSDRQKLVKREDREKPSGSPASQLNLSGAAYGVKQGDRHAEASPGVTSHPRHAYHADAPLPAYTTQHATHAQHSPTMHIGPFPLPPPPPPHGTPAASGLPAAGPSFSPQLSFNAFPQTPPHPPDVHSHSLYPSAPAHPPVGLYPAPALSPPTALQHPFFAPSPMLQNHGLAQMHEHGPAHGHGHGHQSSSSSINSYLNAGGFDTFGTSPSSGSGSTYSPSTSFANSPVLGFLKPAGPIHPVQASPGYRDADANLAAGRLPFSAAGAMEGSGSPVALTGLQLQNPHFSPPSTIQDPFGHSQSVGGRGQSLDQSAAQAAAFLREYLAQATAPAASGYAGSGNSTNARLPQPGLAAAANLPSAFAALGVSAPSHAGTPIDEAIQALKLQQSRLEDETRRLQACILAQSQAHPASGLLGQSGLPAPFATGAFTSASSGELRGSTVPVSSSARGRAYTTAAPPGSSPLQENTGTDARTGPAGLGIESLPPSASALGRRSSAIEARLASSTSGIGGIPSTPPPAGSPRDDGQTPTKARLGSPLLPSSENRAGIYQPPHRKASLAGSGHLSPSSLVMPGSKRGSVSSASSSAHHSPGSGTAPGSALSSKRASFSATPWDRPAAAQVWPTTPKEKIILPFDKAVRSFSTVGFERSRSRTSSGEESRSGGSEDAGSGGARSPPVSLLSGKASPSYGRGAEQPDTVDKSAGRGADAYTKRRRSHQVDLGGSLSGYRVDPALRPSILKLKSSFTTVEEAHEPSLSPELKKKSGPEHMAELDDSGYAYDAPEASLTNIKPGFTFGISHSPQ